MRYITLDAQSVEKLELLRKTDPRYRVRDRAHALLLSNQRLKIKEIARIFKVDRDTVSDWFSRWESAGVEGLADTPGAGRKPSLSDREKKSS